MSSSEVCARLIDWFVKTGTTEAVLAPGSRSGPLATALAEADRQGALRLHVRVDEREAGFLALGLAKASRRWVPVVTTSGTATANLYPAVMEARHVGARLVVLTADRPARLRGTGANQTTDQRRLFTGVPSFAVTSAAHPGEVAKIFEDVFDAAGGGPAQLNLELDEPLLEPVSWTFERRAGLDWSAARAPREFSGPPLPLGPRTVVVAGDDAGRTARRLAEAAGWPLLAEPSSGARNGDNVIVGYRPMLTHSPLSARIERVVSLGHPTLSRPVTSLLTRPDVDVVHVGGPGTFPAPAGPRTTFVDEAWVDGVDDASWLDAWRAQDALATAAVDAVLDGTTPLDVARAVNAAVPPHGLLFVGSSSPVRDLDLVARPYVVGEKRMVMANRGLAGIDGLLSTAIGAALAREERHSGATAIAYVGDISFLHGSNGLLIGPGEPRPDLTIVVVNDDGGSIFATLEQGAPDYASSFERVFATPTGADVGALCAGYGVPHRRVAPVDLAAALAEPSRGIRVLEVPVRRDDRRELGARLDAAVAAAVGA